MTTTQRLGFQLTDEYKKQLELSHDAIDVNNWSDYTHQSKMTEPIGNHLYDISYHISGPLITNNEKYCIHQSCQTIGHCVTNLFNCSIHPFFAISSMSLSHKLFAHDCPNKTLCNHCLLVMMATTRNCDLIIDKLYEFYCYSNTTIYSNPSCYYFFHIILIYPFVIKYILKHTSNIHKLWEILIFYLTKIDIHSVEHGHSSFCNPQRGYNITNKSLIAVNIFEYNLSCILLVFCAFVPHLKKQHLLKLIQLKLPQILVDFISNSDYMKLPHIQSNINQWYRRKKSMKIVEEIGKIQRFGRTLRLIKGKIGDTLELLNIIDSTNITSAKLLEGYSFLFEKMKKFKDNNQFSAAYDILQQVTLPQIAEYKNHSLEEVIFAPETVRNAEVTDQFKLIWFVQCNVVLKRQLLKLEKARIKRINQCANNQCRFRNNNGKKMKKYKLCGGCKFVLYCCRKCQKIDWTLGHHREFCKKRLSIPLMTVTYLNPAIS
eukprot:269545_1